MPSLRSIVWGNTPNEITQAFGVNEPGVDDSMYAYAVDLGYPYGTHVGLDVAMGRGTPIYALNDGTVETAGMSESFRPKPVWIKAKDDPDTREDESGLIEIYGHLWENTVTAGQQVKKGQAIGVSGEQTKRGTMTPDGSGPHLHFELREEISNSGQFRALDPTNYLQKKGSTFGDAGATPDAAPGGDETASGSPFDFVGEITGQLADFAQRGFFVLIGVGLLALGVNAVIKAETGTSLGTKAVRVGRSVSRVIPAARVASLVKR